MYKKAILIFLTIASGFILTMGFFKYKNRAASRYLQLLTTHNRMLYPVGSDHFYGLPLNNPPFLKASDAKHMQDDDLVIGINYKGIMRAYPGWVVSSYNVVNDTIHDKPILVTYCETCHSASAFIAELPNAKKRSISFVTCMFKNKFLSICDLQSSSLWNPFSGVAAEGVAKDYQLLPIPVKIVKWKEWRNAHPESDVIDSSDEQRNRAKPDAEKFHNGHLELQNYK